MTGKRLQISILGIMGIVIAVAIDFALWRSMSESSDYFFMLMTLPLLNIMFLSVPSLKRSHPRRSFWIGFDAYGLVLVGVFLYFHLDHPIGTQLGWLGQLARITTSPRLSWIFIKEWGVIAVLFTIPEILLSCLAGWLATSYRIVFEKEPDWSYFFKPKSSVDQ